MRASGAAVDRSRRRIAFQRGRCQRVIMFAGANWHDLLRTEFTLRRSGLWRLIPMSKTFKHVFGPVPSRRLGRSLGVDLVPFKTCTYDCVYCQLGRTTCKTVERKEWVPTNAVLDELKQKLASRPDYITLSGSGEPTLHSHLGEIIEHIQAMSDIPVAVLTNGSLLWQEAVREELAQADVVLPSLSAGDSFQFVAFNRPDASLTFEQVVEGLVAFRHGFVGQYWLEVFLLGDYNDIEARVRPLADWVKRIQPDRVQLNTATRPPAEEYAVPVPPEGLTELARLFSPQAEVIADHHRQAKHFPADASRQTILALLQRRPCSTGDVARALGLNPSEAVKLLAGLEAEGQVRQIRHGSGYFYQPRHPRRGT
jgi:wyosine [tRNA(Phe)-imidazoG37] synthetase (radical SAM superfamily)